MIKALQLVVAPFDAWTRIATAQRGAGFVLFLFVLPLLVLCVGAESYALIRWGETREGFSHLVKVPEPLALRYAAAQIVLLLGGVTLGAFGLYAVTGSFHMRSDFRSAFSTVAYGFSPVILARLLDAVPMMPTWICWGIGALLSMSVLYHGVGLVMKPDQTKGFGLYMIGSIIVVFCSGLAHLFAVAVLHGKILKMTGASG